MVRDRDVDELAAQIAELGAAQAVAQHVGVHGVAHVEIDRAVDDLGDEQPAGLEFVDHEVVGEHAQRLARE